MNPDLPSSAGSSAQQAQPPLQKQTNPIVQDDVASGDDSDNDKPSRRSGRRKIKIEYIEDKNRRHITFSKRKAGIMKKAYELSTLTGTQVLLLVVSETGLVYTFTTVKLQPIVTKPEGKNLIQACLNAPDPVPQDTSSSSPAPDYGNASPNVGVDKNKGMYDDKKPEPSGYTPPPQQQQHPHQHQQHQQHQQQHQQQQHQPSTGSPAAPVGGYQSYPGGNWNNNNHPGYMAAAAAAAAASPYQQQQHPSAQQQQPHYSGGPVPSYYGAPPPHHHQQQPPQQQSPYLPQQQQQQGYWSGSSAPRSHPSMTRQDQHPGSPVAGSGENKADNNKPGANN